jgi:hypothetical protein
MKSRVTIFLDNEQSTNKDVVIANNLTFLSTIPTNSAYFNCTDIISLVGPV